HTRSYGDWSSDVCSSDLGTGRIGLAMIKKCSGFDMNILCYDPAYQNHEFMKVIQELMDLRHARGIQKDKTWIRYVDFNEALRQRSEERRVGKGCKPGWVG